jgi:hypothetical protein
MSKLANIAIVLALILGAVGGYRAYGEHEQLSTLNKLQDIQRTLNRDAANIAAESSTSIGQSLGMSVANLAQARIDEYQEAIDLHESRQRTNYILVGISLVLFTFGLIVLRKRKQVVSIKTNDESPAVVAVNKMIPDLHEAAVIESDNKTITVPVKNDNESDITVTDASTNRDVAVAAAFFFITIVLVGAAVYTTSPKHSSVPNPATAVSTTPVQPPAPPPSRWKTSVDVNSLDNKKLVTISTNDVVIRCGRKFEGYIVPTLHNLGGMLRTEDGHQQEVRYKLDGGKVQRETWVIADSFDALFLPTSVLRELPKHKTLTVEYQPEYTTNQTESFDLSELGQAVAAGCPASVTPKKVVKMSEPAP